MEGLSGLPKEILQNCFCYLDPSDIASISRCSKYIYSSIYDNTGLHKDMCFQQIDSPSRNAYGIKAGPWNLPETQPSVYTEDWFIHNREKLALLSKEDVKKYWKEEFLNLLQFINILKCDSLEKKRQNLEFIIRTAVRYLRASSSVYSTTVPRLVELFSNQTNQDIILCQSTIFSRARGDAILESYNALPMPPLCDIDRNLSAKLHCLYGVPIQAIGRTRSKKLYPFACSIVYDIRNYTHKTKWGPFLRDGSGRVDWEMIEATMVVISHNVKQFGQLRSNEFCKSLWTTPWEDAVPYSYVPKVFEHNGEKLFTTETQSTLDDRDPYGVTGTWMRVVCFLDYSEFFAYNFAHAIPMGTPRAPVDTEEATRYIIMELTVTKIEAPGPDDGPLPVVHFKGISRSMHQSWDPNANSNLRGTVRLTPEGEIRWTTNSVYYGEERWRSESIQIGGIRSGRGAFGNWFDKDFDPHGPVGPTAFWKVSDKLLERSEEVVALVDADADIPYWTYEDDDDDAEDGDYGEAGQDIMEGGDIPEPHISA